uniref:BPTI/Kunitz inhibitor domain-containing protein n=1 Tax=Stegastes partitus TaxID=144197 RepID=A0A3B5AYA9_9TELE
FVLSFLFCLILSCCVLFCLILSCFILACLILFYLNLTTIVTSGDEVNLCVCVGVGELLLGRLYCSCAVNVCVLLSARCQLDSDSGIQCADFVQVWFFDKHIGACSPFWYGGCGGNANRFNTEHECFRTCVAHNACFLSQDQGSCQNYSMMWFFDTEQNECARFWYGGCGGNENRFKTQEECENLCLTKSRKTSGNTRLQGKGSR